MPEGHTLHRLARDLGAAFTGRTVASTSPQGRFADSAAALDGALVEGAEAYGKHLFVDLRTVAGEPQVVHVHLGLYGSFAVHPDAGPEGVPEPRGQVRWRLVTQDGPPAYADLRGATACELMVPGERQGILDRLGPDPLRADADPDRGWERVRRSRAPIGTLLMDQSVLAGVGNVYRAEVLFRHRLHPLRPGNTLRAGQFAAVWEDLVALLEAGVEAGRIVTTRPEHPGQVYVYRRDGEPCRVCGATVRTAEQAARNVFWCPRCQPVFRSRAKA
ncbi:DNA-formamidopyrimidine glycosylase family protein [uncultured Nocardioides sp.]|uniref:Fpg/Nei family DNA glycosylase n=1 Tax=uncultured Nocardioides sp. TaxID=198441 RepID=UPI002603461F|nr:DNA-formamidopyrimidine glycosylase family protein [uncultured Nocardioides sp.]